MGCGCFLISIFGDWIVSMIKGVERMNTAVLSGMHFLVDLICAWAMFGTFAELGYESYLVYNFCAFALQMPLGTLLDLLYRKKGNPYLPVACTLLGLVLTCIGAMLHPAVLGVGNALFHVGGGMDVILDDFRQRKKGRELGLFVAPGAVGLFLGTRMGKARAGSLVILAAMAVLLAIPLLRRKRTASVQEIPADQSGKGILILAAGCFAVVVLRSFVGMSVSFAWKTGAVYPLLAVLAVALGKLSGGFAAARFGCVRTAGWSLLVAAVCFLMGQRPIFGLAALFFFNISMPVTLYLLAERLPELPGFSFGLLTFGLFLGFLPVYAGAALPVSGCALGAAGSVLSALILKIAGKAVEKPYVSA